MFFFGFDILYFFLDLIFFFFLQVKNVLVVFDLLVISSHQGYVSKILTASLLLACKVWALLALFTMGFSEDEHVPQWLSPTLQAASNYSEL